VDRVTTGNPKLDEILEGGFQLNSLNIIAGGPGTGKTILSQQFVFANATPERPAVYLTTLSEPAPKLIRYLQEFAFFDDDRLYGDTPAIVYRDIAQDIRERGLETLPALVGEIIQQHAPALLVIDSFKALRDLGTPSAHFRQVLFDLAGTLTAYACTTLLVGEYSATDIETLPEFAVVDGVVNLVNQKYGVRDERYLRVLKLRGSGFRSGEHAFRLGKSGVDVFPRLVTPPQPTGFSLVAERVATGLAEFDTMLGGGLLRGSTTLLAGPTGSGKTILSLHFLFEGVARGEPGLLLSFQENPSTARRNIGNLGMDPTQLDEEGLLTLLYVSPVEMNIDDVMERIVSAVETKGIRRVVVDSLADLEATTTSQERFRSYIYSVLQYLAVNGQTTYMTLESYPSTIASPLSQSQISYLCDNAVSLRYGEVAGEILRTLTVLKTRASGHDPRVRGFTIGDRGITIPPAAAPTGQSQPTESLP
jgi:circadian clock protein KaiC